MSAVETSERFRVLAMPWTLPNSPYHVVDFGAEHTEQVDHYHSRSAAQYAARLLNDGLATVNPHAVVGCRVEVE